MLVYTPAGSPRHVSVCQGETTETDHHSPDCVSLARPPVTGVGVSSGSSSAEEQQGERLPLPDWHFPLQPAAGQSGCRRLCVFS